MTVNNWQPADPEVARLLDRVRAGEAVLTARIEAMEEAARAVLARGERRRNRTWVLVLGICTGVIAPLVVTGVLTLLHLRSLG